MIREDAIHKERIRRLEELTDKLTGPSNGTVQYEVENGISFGFTCFAGQNVNIQRTVLSKGTRFPMHDHEVHEWLIVYVGEIIVHVNGEDVRVSKAQSISFPPGTPHAVDAVEDTWLLGISVPPAQGYPT